MGALAALIAPFVFVILVLAQGLQYSDYSHVALPISALAAWPIGWIQSANFVLLGVGMLGFATTMHQNVRPDDTGIVGPSLLGLCGVGLILAAAFPWTRNGGSFAVPPAHLAGAALTFIGVGGGLVVISRRIAADPQWRHLASYTLASGVAILVLFLATITLARSETAPLHSWLGLLQRLALVVWFSCMAALSWHSVRRTRPEEAVPSPIQ